MSTPKLSSRMRSWFHAPLVAVTFLGCAADAPAPAEPEPTAVVVTTVDALPVASATAPVVQRVASDGGPRGTSRVPVTLFMMSQCPYAAQMLAQLAPLLDELDGRVDFLTEYIGSVTPAGELTSMHGRAEVDGDLLQLCSRKHAPAWRNVVGCMAASVKSVPGNFKECAAKHEVDPRSIETCAQSSEGAALLANSFDTARDMGVRASPTLLIDGVKYDGQRKPTAFKRAICAAFTDAPPATCRDLPVPVDVAVTILTDRRCAECDHEKLLKSLRSMIGKPTFTMLDYGTQEGRALAEALGEVKLPLAVFDASLDRDPDLVSTFSKRLKESNGKRFMPAGSQDPTCLDDGGCKKASCALTPHCRKEQPRVLEVFLMSKCPFAAKGLTALEELLAQAKTRGERIEVRPRLIGSGDAKSGFNAMHGAREVEENLRYACAAKHYAAQNKFLSYMNCRGADLKSDDWAACTGKTTGIDKGVLERCSTGAEGPKLLEASYKLSADTGFGASPTWLANAKFKFAGVTADALQKGLCAHNELKVCSANFPSSAARPPSGP